MSETLKVFQFISTLRNVLGKLKNDYLLEITNPNEFAIKKFFTENSYYSPSTKKKCTYKHQYKKKFLRKTLLCSEL